MKIKVEKSDVIQDKVIILISYMGGLIFSIVNKYIGFIILFSLCILFRGNELIRLIMGWDNKNTEKIEDKD